MEPRRRRQRCFGQPRAADRPRQTTPIPPPPRSVQLPLGPGHALSPPPPRAAFRSAARPRSGAGERRCLEEVTAAAGNYEYREPSRQYPTPLSPTTQRASPWAQPMETEPGKKGARVRMRLRKAMLPTRGQQPVHLARRSVGGLRAPTSVPLACLGQRPYFLL